MSRRGKAGDCFEAAAKFLLARHAMGLPTDGWRLVHGIAVGQGPIAGVFIGHGWVESLDGVDHVFRTVGGGLEWVGVLGHATVHDLSGGGHVQLPARLYYSVGRIREEYVRRYTVEEMREMLSERQTWGSWELPPVVDGVEVAYA